MKKFIIKVNGTAYDVEVEEVKTKTQDNKSITQAPKVNLSSPIATKPSTTEKKDSDSSLEGASVVTAPMPGTILKIMVENGQEVSSGQVLFILEAMKMENEIQSPKNGKVGSIYVNKGQSVSVGDTLIVIQ